jgi:hypothetical protein
VVGGPAGLFNELLRRVTGDELLRVPRFFSVSSVAGRDSTQRSLRGSVCSVFKFGRQGGHGDPVLIAARPRCRKA